MTPDEIAVDVARRLAAIDGVAAVALGGSRARGDADRDSDVDLGIYYDPAWRPDLRALRALRALAREVDDRHPDDVVTDFGGWGPWINGGAWLTVGDVRVDWLYRDLTRVAEVTAECEAGRATSHDQPGYPHGFHSYFYMAEVHHGRALVDLRGAFAALQARTRPYPSRLRDALVRQHLWDAGFALENAVKPAARGDTVFVAGCLHRCAACLLQVIFALNRRYPAPREARPPGRDDPRAPPRRIRGDADRRPRRPGATPAALRTQIDRLEALVTSTRTLTERL